MQNQNHPAVPVMQESAFWSAAARRRFLSFSVAQSRKKESGVEPPHSRLFVTLL